MQSKSSQISDKRCSESIFNFILSERFLTLTVIGSIFTYAFVSSMKGDLIDPFLQFLFSEDYFDFMDVTLRDGEKMPRYRKKLELRFGNFFKEFITWMFVMFILHILCNYTSYPRQPGGNPGVAIM